MKRIFTYCVMCLCLAACTFDETGLQEQIDELDVRLTAFQEQLNSLIDEFDDLVDLIEGNQFIANVQENEDGSHTLVLVTAAGVQSEIIIRNGTDGESGHSPQISVREVDGVMYWTIDGEFVLDTEGQRIPVTGEDGATPEFKIENGIWYVSYDGWATSLECGPAQTEADPSVFKDASLSEDGKYAYLTLVDGTVLTFEIYRQFGIVFDSAEKYVSSGSGVSVPFTITGADENTVMETICSSGWTAEVTMNEDWTGTLDIAAPAESSTGKVIVLVNDGGYKTLMRTLTFISGTLNISTSSVQVPASGGPVTVEVETDMEYEVSIPEDAQGWISVVETRSEMRTETLTLSVGANETGLPRQAEIELVSGDAVIETVLVYQLVDYDKDIMVLTVQARELTGTAASYSRKVYIPLYGAVNVHVDWGDGSSEDVNKTVTSAATMIQHEYAAEGQYCVTVKGTAAQMKGTAVNKNAAPAITGVIQWGMLGLTSLEDAFRYNTSITAVPMPEDGAFAAVTTVEGMFEGCTSLVSVPEGLLSSATALVDAAMLFSDCASLTEVPERLFASSPLINDVSGMFNGCLSITSVPAGLLAGLPEITKVSNMFKECTSLTTVPENFFSANTKIENMSGLFNLCSALKTVPAGLFRGLEAVTNISTMFKGCTALESVPSGLFDDQANVTSMNSLFSTCPALGNLPADIFMNMTKVTSASYLYEGCTDMTEFPSIRQMTSLKTVPAMWKDCSAITSVPADYFPASVSGGISVAYMFQNCTALKSVPEGLFDDFSGVTTMNQMFENCTSLESLPTGIFDSMVKVTSANQVFNGCSAFTGESPYTLVDGEKVHLYERSTDNGFAVIKNHKNTFTGCEKMADYAFIPIDWGGISDGTSGLPVLALGLARLSGSEYFKLDITIKGSDVKECRYVLGTKESIEKRVEELGDYEKVCNRYGTTFSTSVVDKINSADGYSASSGELEAGTEYMLVVMAENVHGKTIETAVASTAAVPEGEADYQRYIGTWTVTSTSSEVDAKPQTFTVEIEPFRVNESFRVSGWGITTMGDKDVAPFIMDYADGKVSVSTYDYYGMIGMYYVYLRYRFQQNGEPYIWVTEDALCTGTYGSDGTVTLEMGKFTLPTDGKEYQVTGMDYVLYSGGSYYESLDLFKPGYTVSDYGIGPYTLTRSSQPQNAVRRSAAAGNGEFCPVLIEPKESAAPSVKKGAFRVSR